MTDKQEKKFRSICSNMRKLIDEMEGDHPDIQFFIDDGTPYLLDCPSYEQPKNHVLTDGGIFWPRSGGGGF